MITDYPVANTDAETIEVTFASDLHLFSDRSTGMENRQLIADSIAQSNVCVWGGDLFDLRWTRSPVRQTIDLSLQWLNGFTEEFPQVTFVYLYGNHDWHLPLRNAIEDYAAKFETSPQDDYRQRRFLPPCDAIRIGETVFVHGDVIERAGKPDGFSRYRDQWAAKPVAGRFQNSLYNVAVGMHIHRGTARAFHPPRRTCQKLADWARRNTPPESTPVQRVVFGHTHQPLNGFTQDGITFHNGGAAIKNVPFQPIRLRCQLKSRPE